MEPHPHREAHTPPLADARLPSTLGPVPAEIRFYRPSDAHFAFTNFSPHGIFAFGRLWRTVEHFFQAQKFTTTDPAWAEVICEAETPLKAAGFGRNIHHPIRPDWEQVKDGVMRYAVATKFETHADLREHLRATGTAVLRLDSPTDSYWGIGATGTGQNRLGIILMEVRDILSRHGSGEALSRYREQHIGLFHRDER